MILDDVAHLLHGQLAVVALLVQVQRVKLANHQALPRLVLCLYQVVLLVHVGLWQEQLSLVDLAKIVLLDECHEFVVLGLQIANVEHLSEVIEGAGLGHGADCADLVLPLRFFEPL